MGGGRKKHDGGGAAGRGRVPLDGNVGGGAAATRTPGRDPPAHEVMADPAWACPEGARGEGPSVARSARLLCAFTARTLRRGVNRKKSPGPALKSLAELESLKFAQAKIRIDSVILRYYPTCRRLEEAARMKRLSPEGDAGGADDGGLGKFAEDEEDEEGLPFVAPSLFSSRIREPQGQKKRPAAAERNTEVDAKKRRVAATECLEKLEDEELKGVSKRGKITRRPQSREVDGQGCQKTKVDEESLGELKNPGYGPRAKREAQGPAR